MLIKLTKRVAKIVFGFAFLAAGLIMLVTPGPGLVAIALALALLATEFRWAGYLLDRLKAKYAQVRDALRGSAQKT